MVDQLESGHALKRDVGFWGLLFSSVGSVIGSGWLFGALLATELAGAAALLSWIIASVIVTMLALVHAELGGMFPVAGGTSRFPHYAFGSFAGASFGWFAYIQAATVAPIEVLATIQYTSSISWAAAWYKPATNTLSGIGIVVAIILVVAFTTLNLVGIRWLANVNTAMTWWKIFVPVLAVVVLVSTHFHAHNFTAGGFFLPGASGGFKAVMLAIPGGGIVFSLLGFEQAVQLGGEARNPGRDVPRAVIYSILIGAVIYIAAQFAFIASVNPGTLAHFHTWAGLAAGDPALNQAPFATVAVAAGLGWLAWLLRVDAVVSPGGTGLIYLTSASRIAYGLSRNGYVPEAFEKTTPRTRVPVMAIVVSSCIGVLFLLPFPSWSKLVGIVTSASVLMYAGAPLSLGALRLQRPDMERPYSIPMAKIVAPLAFCLANFIVYWAGWQTYSTLMIVMLIGYLLLIITRVFHLNSRVPNLDLQGARWLLPYLIGLGTISYFGQFGSGGIIGFNMHYTAFMRGGNLAIPLYADLLVLTIFSLAIYYLAMHSRLTNERQDEYIGTTSV